MGNNSKSVYHTASFDGLVLGIFMLLAFVMQAASMRFAVLGLLSSAMVLAVPVAAFTMMRRGYRDNVGDRQFSALWMHGITIFIFGSLILGLGQYIYTRFVQPDFILHTFQTAADTYLSLPNEDYQHFGHLLQNIIDKHLLPTPIGLAFSAMWIISFVGSLLSLPLALIVKATNRRLARR